MKGHQCRALQKSSFFITFLGVFTVPAGKGKLEKIFQIFDFFPAGKGKLEKISVRKSSS